MSLTGNGRLGIPLLLLQHCEGLEIEVEIKGGDLYRGTLDHSDDEMNIVLKDCSYTDGHGRQKKNVSAGKSSDKWRGMKETPHTF